MNRKAETPLNPEPDTSIDGFLDGNLSIMQPVKGARAGIDPVFLAAVVAEESEQKILDVGAGVGVASLCLAARLADARICGLELHPWLADVFAQNIRRNNFGDRMKVVAADVFAPMTSLQAEGLQPASFDHVVTNPPFYRGEQVSTPKGELRALAHVNPMGLERWLGRCCGFLRPGGRLSVIYPASDITELLAAIGNRLGEIRLYFLWAGEAKAASRVICQGVLGSRAPLQVLAGMTLHEANGDYTRAAQKVLREGGAIALC